MPQPQATCLPAENEEVLSEGSLGSVKILPKHRPCMSNVPAAGLTVSVVGH